MIITATAQAAEQRFSAPMDQADWHVEASPLQCRLTHKIPDYGILEVIKRPLEEHKLLLHSYNRIHQAKNAKITGLVAPWRRGQVMPLGNVAMQTGNTPIKADRLMTKKLLGALDAGQCLQFEYHSELGDTVKVIASIVDFQESYSQYMDCVGDLLTFKKHQVKNTKIQFNKESYSLGVSDKKVLDKIQRIVNADPSIKVVRIDGYTDKSGRTGHNNYLSERRARIVAEYLMQYGVPQEKISLNWHGKKSPIASNKNDTGRAKNRRVEVKLID